jgi:MFS family permease
MTGAAKASSYHHGDLRRAILDAGEAELTERGLASFSLGTDTAGSGRVPAAFNNLIGLKPSLGRIPTTGVVPACRTLDVVSVFALVYGLTQLIYGSLGDRYGKLRVVSYTTLGCGVGSLLAVFAGSLEALVLARVLAAAFAAAIIPLSVAWTGDAVPYEQRQETLARVGLGTTLGIFSGQLIGGLLTDTLGWRYALLALAVFGAATLALLAWSWTRIEAAQGSDAPRWQAPAAALRAWVLPEFGMRSDIIAAQLGH